MLRKLIESQGARVIFWLIVLVVIVAACVPLNVRATDVPPFANAHRREYVRIVRSEIGIDAPIASLAGQIAQESMFDCRAVSRVGAAGCAQFMPTTSLWIGDVDKSLKSGDVHSAQWAFRAQAVYMKWLFERVKADDRCEQWAFASSAYNGGLGYVYRRQKLSKKPGRCYKETCLMNPGITPGNQRENEEYPQRIEFKWAPVFHDAGWGEKACSKG